MKNLKTMLVYLLLILVTLTSIGPFMILVNTGLKGPNETIYNFHKLPENPTLQNYIKVWKQISNLPRYFFNSVFIAVSSIILNLLVSSLAGYPLARFKFPGRNLIFTSILATMMIPAQLTMIPMFLLCRKLGMVDSYAGVILPGIAGAFGIFMMRQAYMAIPDELEDAGRIDGASELGLWWKIMLPLTKPTMATLGIFIFVGSWSSFLWPLIILPNAEHKHPLPVAIAKLMDSFAGEFKLVAAVSVLSVIPIIVIFIFTQRYFVKGLAGAVKG